MYRYISFFFNDTATTEIYTLSLHDALPILPDVSTSRIRSGARPEAIATAAARAASPAAAPVTRRPVQCRRHTRSEEHTSELQSRQYLVCRLLLEKKKKSTSEEHAS